MNTSCECNSTYIKFSLSCFVFTNALFQKLAQLASSNNSVRAIEHPKLRVCLTKVQRSRICHLHEDFYTYQIKESRFLCVQLVQESNRTRTPFR